MDKKFDLIVEGDPEDAHQILPHQLELKGLVWNEDMPPDIVIISSLMLVKVGRYLAPGDKYQYRIAEVAKLVDGRLVKP